MLTIVRGILIPFLGTALGAGCVYMMKGELKLSVQRGLSGFAAGVMVAASIWSLLIPAMNYSEHLGKLAFLPAAIGFWLGMLFLMLLDKVVPHLHMFSNENEGPASKLDKDTMLMLAMTIHNIPEGMAVGVVYASLLAGDGVSVASALALSIGIAIQNFPEGAVLSLPLRSSGISRGKAFGYGVLSGVVEPIGAVITILAARFVVPILPYLLAFAAGSMMYVVVEELVPEMSEGEHSHIPVLLFAAGFSLMMILDVALG